MAEETVVTTQDAPAADAAGQGAPATTSKAEPAQDGASKAPATNGDQSGQPAFDVQKSYDELRSHFTKVSQNAARDRKMLEQTLKELSALKGSHGELAKLLSQATKKEVTPEQLMQQLQSQGLKALDPFVADKIKEAVEPIQNGYVEQANRALALESQLEKLYRRQDTENYPDFQKLEPVMQEIADAEDCPIDWNQPTSVIYDTLYKLARSRSSEDAVKAAEEFGKKQAEKQLGKEAAAAVPGSGKAGAPPDSSKLSLADLRKVMVSQLGEAE